ncbi:putative ABC transport system substrate-binding protein [Desulfonatronum thiosulfatophilum]|uniref:Putative ABC transport system substrate-binding protein n=1 Tax=Desulfonatronum thiosulfatophilum TaxID=617002 RepID=A0A1G6DXK1_9BACT|nr:ABC transporter substrate-binding protein [Desulfonatronum thiosulfatophilum]SDB49876.1 putative ABC transport system substrate-binding protein [Desulfonatronum thiosulfatophilum]
MSATCSGDRLFLATFSHRQVSTLFGCVTLYTLVMLIGIASTVAAEPFQDLAFSKNHAVHFFDVVHTAQLPGPVEKSLGATSSPSGDPAIIYLALYRGITEAEQGFMDYLRASELESRFIIRDAAGNAATVETMRTEIKELRPDLVYAFGSTVATILAGTWDERDPELHVTDLPILFNIVADPVGARLVETLQKSGRNITGTTHAVPIDAQGRTLRRALTFNRLGVIYNPLEVNSRLSVDALANELANDDITVIRAPITVQAAFAEDAATVAAATKDLLGAGVEVIYLPSDSTIITHAKIITDLTNTSGIPTFSATEAPIRTAGAVMGLTSAYYNVGQFAGYKAVQILRGLARVEEIPIESLNRFTFVVNVPAAIVTDGLPPMELLRIGELLHPPPSP